MIEKKRLSFLPVEGNRYVFLLCACSLLPQHISSLSDFVVLFRVALESWKYVET